MKKLVILVIIAAAFLVGYQLKKGEKFGGSFQQPLIISALQPGTNRICGPQRDTILSASSSARTRFIVSVASSTPIYLRWQDRGTGAGSWGAGLYLNGSGGVYQSEAGDFYTGAYSCYATASTTVSIVEL